MKGERHYTKACVCGIYRLFWPTVCTLKTCQGEIKVDDAACQLHLEAPIAPLLIHFSYHIHTS